ncbi:MAG: AAA family ATPase [Streptosporangiaceae bacterium]
MPRLTPDQARDVMSQALARLQESQPAWRKADLVRHLGELLPDDVACPDDATAATLLTGLADQVLAGGAGERVLMLEAPEWPRVPDSLRRADGRSIYRPHSGTRYTTLAQLTIEDRLVVQAQQPGAPRIEPALTARLLGADLAQLEAQLRAGAQSRDPAQADTGPGLRLDQAAAGFLAVTSDRRAEVLVGPAGSGKTRTAAVVAAVWRKAGMGEVYGLTTSQAARDVLREAGVDLASNTADFLGHLTGAREVRGPKALRPGTLLLLDEASMMSMADLAAIMRLATERDCRVLITGDHEQLAAVEGGGGMVMLARQMGYIQLAEPVRFNQEWERDATLRLRAGDTTAAALYDEHGRVRGGDPEEAIDLACRAFLADHLAGKDSLLLARTQEQAREMSRRVRDELLHYGLVRRAGEVQLRHQAIASEGDLIVARKNNRRIIAGTPGHWLTNRDVLRIQATTGRTVTVRRLAGRNAAGRPLWTATFELPKTYLFRHCDLAYATTAHAAQGRTVDTSHVLVDGLGDRQGLYVALSRGRDGNYAYCITRIPRAADVRQGSLPAPELARLRRITRERAGLEPEPRAAGEEETAPSRDPAAVLADALRRDGTVFSATETLRGELANADHLGVLGSIWYDLVRRSQANGFEALLQTTLSPADAQAVMGDPACSWLWRTLREAECAGLGAEKALRDAVAESSLSGVRHMARVIDARIRRVLDGRVPQLPGPWSQRVPAVAGQELRRYLTELAAAMDDRVRRLGEHALQARPMWVIEALGEVPDDPATRALWVSRAAQLSAYRELYGYDDKTNAIGAEPGKNSPEARADWHAAFAALGRAEGIDLRGCTDGQLRLRRRMYERETSWAPPFVDEELRLARLQGRAAWENAIRSEHQAGTVRDVAVAARHQAVASMWRAMETKAARVADGLAAVHETRRQWEALTEPSRRVAVAADMELRRRHPDMSLEPLKSAEPEGIALRRADRPSHRESWVQGTLEGSEQFGREQPDHSEAEERPLTAEQREAAGQEALGLTPQAVHEEIPDQVLRIRETVRLAQARIDDLQDTRVPGEDPDDDHLGRAWEVLGRRERDTIVQPPKPDIVPAREIMQRAQQRVADREGEPA